MVALKRHARLLYLLALFQLLGGPLVLGGLMMVARLTADREISLSQSVAQTLQKMGRADANGQDTFNEHIQLPASKSTVPKPAKLKDTKDKLWAVNEFSGLIWARPEPLKIPVCGWHDPVPRRLANAPPLPPPRVS